MIQHRYQRPARPALFINVPVEALLSVPAVWFLSWKAAALVFYLFGLTFANLFGVLIGFGTAIYYIIRWWRITSENPFAGQEMGHGIKNRVHLFSRRFLKRMSHHEKGRIHYVSRR